MTNGEKRIRVTFNPSNSDQVHILKTKAAELINEIDQLPCIDSDDLRLRALAMTAIEEGAMWAVKLATSLYAPVLPEVPSTPTEPGKPL